MSSIPNPVSRQPAQAPPASGLLPSTESVRQTLHQHLRKTASFIKFMDALVLLARWVAAILTIWLAACVVDHWLWPLPSAGRWLFWSAGLAACGWWLVWQFLPLLIGRINPLYAAKRIEHLVPEFKNGLIAWLELETLPEQRVPVGVMSALAHRAARFIGGQDPSATVDTSPLIKMIGSVLILTTSLALYAMLTPKSVLATGQRILFPWSSLAAPTRVTILEVTPGSVELTQGKPLAVEVTLKGLGRDDTVAVRYSSLDGQLQNLRTELSANSEGFRYSGNVRTNGSGVEQPIEYWIEAGDAQQGPFRVTISPLPAVVLQTIDLQFPAYTRLPNRTLSGEEVEAVEGTRATITARANQTLRRGRLEINPTLDDKGEVVRADSFLDMTTSDRQLQATLPLLLDAQGNNPTRIEYRIRGTNSRGDSNARPITHRLSVLADVAPEVNLLGPENRLLRVHRQARVNLEVRASDPDFGLTRLTLHATRDGVAAAPIVLLEDADGVRGRQVKTYAVDLTRWQATVGQRFELRAQATDNRHDPRTGQPAANLTESQVLTLLVVADQEPADHSPNREPQSADNPPAPQSADAQSDSPPAESENNAQPNNTSPNSDTPSPNEQNSEQQSTGEQSTGEQSTGEQSTGEQSTGEQSTGEQSTGEQSTGEQSTGEQSSGEQSSGQQSSGQQSSGQQSSGQQSSGQQSSGQQSSGQQSSGQQSSGQQSSGQQSSGQQSSGQQSSGQQSSGQQSSGQQSSGQQSSGQQSSGERNSGQSGESPGDTGDAGADNHAASETPRDGKSADSPSRGKPADDGEAMERVSEYMKSQSPTAPASASPDQQAPKSENSKPQGSDSQGSDSQGSDSQGSDSQGSDSQGSDSQGSDSQGSDSQGSDSQGSDSQGSDSQGSDSKGSDSKGSDSKGSDPKGSDSQGSDSKGSDSKGSDAQGSDSQGSDAQGSDSQGSDSKGSDPQGSDSKGSDPQGSDSQGSDSKGSDSQGSNAKGSDAQGSDSQGSDSQGSDAKGSDAQGSDAQGSDSQGSDSKGSDSKGSDSKGSDSPGSDSKGSDSPGSDSKGSDPQGSDSKGSDSKGSDSQGSDSKGSDSKGSDSQGSDSKGSDSKGSDSKGSDSKGSDSKGSDSQGSDSQGSDSQGSESQGSESQGSESQGSESQGSESQGAESQGAESQGAESQGAESQGAESQGAESQGAESQGAESQGAESQGAESQGSQPSSPSSSSAPPNPSQPTGSGSGTQGGQGGSTGSRAAADREFAEQTTNMVLEYLNRQKEQPEPELLRELDWTTDDLQRFVERWNAARDLADSDQPADQLKWQQMLEQLNMTPPEQRVRQGSSRNDAFQQMQDGGARLRAPESLRKQFDAYRKALEAAQQP